MPIIIDNFHVNTNLPIDSRFVVGGVDSFYQDKNNIDHKYLGLRVWDLNDNIPYYWNGTEWLSENAVGVSADSSADVNYIPKFTTGPTIIGKSLLFETPTTNQIGVGISNITLINPNIDLNGSNIISDNGGLHVNGNVKTNLYFVGKGDYIKQLNASNISSGSLDIARISNLQSSISGTPITTGSYVLFNTGSVNGVTWKSSDTLSVLNSTNTTNVGVVSDTSSTSNYNITFVQSTGNVPIKINSSKIQFKPSNGQLFLSDGSATEPVYSFLSSVNTGFYYNNQGISTTIQGNEITSVRSYGLVVNNRIYIPVTSNNSDVGYGIVWSTNGNSTNNINTNDGFVYNGQRLNYYGLGSHIPDNSNTQSTLLGRGTYISGYFGVDIFSGNRLKLKIDQYNDVTINSILNINNEYTLGGTTGNNIVLSTMKNTGGSLGNNVVIKDWSVRGNTGNDWLTWKHHNGITIDGYYNTPNGPTKVSGPDSSTYGTLTFWERFPFIREQYFGSEDKKTLTINSTSNPFVKVDGTLLVGTSTITTGVIADFTSITSGILLPRMTTTQRNSISTLNSLIIYNTTKGNLEIVKNGKWESLYSVRNRGFVGTFDIGDNSTGTVTHGGDCTTATYSTETDSNTNNSYIIVTLTNAMDNTNYLVKMFIESTGNITYDNDSACPVFKIISTTQFKIGIAEVASTQQHIKIHFETIQL